MITHSLIIIPPNDGLVTARDATRAAPSQLQQRRREQDCLLLLLLLL